MRTLYIDCSMGAAGDMLAGALAELLPDPDAFFAELNALGIPGVAFQKERAVRCGITGTHVSVTVNGEEEESVDVHTHGHDHMHTHDGEHAHDHDHAHAHTHTHSSLHDIEHIVRGHLPVSDQVKDDVMAVYRLIAEAESHVHGVSADEIHFHEVGTMDAVADITAVCMLMERLAPQQVIVSPIHVGSGQVQCAHGILPVPAPATAYILRDVPVYGGSIRGELCTPTGAALLVHFASQFGEMPVMRTQAIGYGMGKKEFAAANCVRALLGETAEEKETVVELHCNMDDMTAEEIGFASEQLFASGALEVYTIPAGMKKSRPGTLLSVMCREADRDRMLELLFQHTTTLGVREQTSRRYTLARRMETVETPAGAVRKKVSEGYGVTREKYEYEDLAAIARREGISLQEARRLTEQAEEAKREEERTLQEEQQKRENSSRREEQEANGNRSGHEEQEANGNSGGCEEQKILTVQSNPEGKKSKKDKKKKKKLKTKKEMKNFLKL